MTRAYPKQPLVNSPGCCITKDPLFNPHWLSCTETNTPKYSSIVNLAHFSMFFYVTTPQINKLRTIYYHFIKEWINRPMHRYCCYIVSVHWWLNVASCYLRLFSRTPCLQVCDVLWSVASLPCRFLHAFLHWSLKAGQLLLKTCNSLRLRGVCASFTLLTFLKMIVKDRCQAAAECVLFIDYRLRGNSASASATAWFCAQDVLGFSRF